MTELSTHLSEHRIKQRDFARTIGVDQSVVSRLARRAIKPGLDLAFAIERATAGAVPAASWIDAPSTPSQTEHTPSAGDAAPAPADPCEGRGCGAGGAGPVPARAAEFPPSEGRGQSCEDAA